MKKLVLEFLCALFALACISTHANAATYVVDPNGGGDYTSIQAALDAVQGHFAADTIVVHAGAYAENVTLPQRDSQSLLACPAGPESTSVAGLLLGPSTYGVGSGHRDWTVCGLSVGASVLSTPSKARARFEQCAFAADFTVNWLEGGIAMPVSDCEFRGPTALLGIYGIAQSLRFRNAPLRTEARIGELYYADCAFVGMPGETLVVASRTEGLGFTRCTFDSAGVGVWFPKGGYTGLSMDRCRFHRLALAVGAPSLPNVQLPSTNKGISLQRCRWTYCDRAVSWLNGEIGGLNDTLQYCGGAAIRARVETLVFVGLLVEDNLGTALDIELERQSWEGQQACVLEAAKFLRVHGIGAWIRQPLPNAGDFVEITNSRFEQCVTGAQVQALLVNVYGCEFFANSGAGLEVTAAGDDCQLSAQYNSFVANGGDGFVVAVTANGPTSYGQIHHDIFAYNVGAGVRFEAAPPETLYRNDSWSNTGGNFVGSAPDTSNFSLNPRFCDIANGMLGLAYNSPCAAIESYHRIGANDQRCGPVPTGVAPGGGITAFALRPNPSRGEVEFALPPSARGGRLEVFDVQGRVVWSRDVGAEAHALRWTGDTTHGPASSGLYWARFTTAGLVQTRTLIRLR